MAFKHLQINKLVMIACFILAKESHYLFAASSLTETEYADQIQQIQDKLKEHNFSDAATLSDQLTKRVKTDDSGSRYSVAKMLRDWTRDLRDEWNKNDADVKLKKTPDNPSANLAMGRFLALRLNDWAGSLDYLKKSKEGKFAEAVEMQSADIKDGDRLFELAENWWSLGTAKSPDSDLFRALAIENFKKAMNLVPPEKQVIGLKKIQEFTIQHLDASGGMSVSSKDFALLVSAADMEPAAGLKLISFKLPDRRGLTYFHVDGVFENQSSHAVLDKDYTMKVVGLMRDGDKKWNTLTWIKELAIGVKGQSSSGFGGAYYLNDVKLRNNGDERPVNVYVQLRYKNYSIREAFLNKDGPNGWWLDASLISKK